MDKYKKRTLFLYYDPHYFHAELAKALNADFYPSPKLKSEKTNIVTGGASILKAVFALPRNYDIYFCEGTYIIPALAKRFGLIKKDAKIVNILASPFIYYVNTKKIKWIRKIFALNLLKEVNLFVCVGKMEEGILKKILPNAKTIVTYTIINPKIKNALLIQRGISPNLNSHKILAIGTNSTYYKGVDIVFEAFKLVKKRFSDAELNIVGKMPDLSKYVDCNYTDVHCLGYVKNLVTVIKRSSLYVHMGRGDTFPASSLEAMLGGLPVIVSDATGTKEVVDKVDRNMISKLNANYLTNRIIRYFYLDQKEKEALSERFYKIGLKFDKDGIIKKFVNDFNGALK